MVAFRFDLPEAQEYKIGRAARVRAD